MLDPIAQHIERYMDLLSARQKLVAANIANADTPGYKTRDLDFQSEFQRATLQSTDTRRPLRSRCRGSRSRMTATT